MNDLLKNPLHRAKLSYNGFPMPQKADFTFSIGQLLPVYWDLIQPGDKVTARASLDVRTQPLETAANLRSKVRLDWFFVPLEQLFKYFGDMYYNIQDIGSDHVNLTSLAGSSGGYFNGEYPLGPNFRDTFPNFNMKTFFVDTMISLLDQENYTADSSGNYLTPYFFLNNAVLASDSLRLADACGFPISEIMKGLTTESAALSPSLFIPMAYQKIYSDYYRLTDREPNNPTFYNFDSWINAHSITQSRLQDIFKLRYIPLMKDFHTNIFVSPLQGAYDNGSLGNIDQLFNSWLSLNKIAPGVNRNSVYPLYNSYTSPTSVYGAGTNFNGDANSFVSTVNTNSIRGMFAVEKALEITRRSAKHYDAQTLAHWGVEPPKSIAGEVLYLGSQIQPFVIGDVVSSAASGDEPLGTIAGKGYSSDKVDGSNTRPVHYDGNLNCHGLIMCIACIQPEITYTQRGLDKLNLLTTPKDFLHPEFDNMGMQPYYFYQYLLPSGTMSTTPDTIYGWQYAYSEIKFKQNRVFGGVHNDGTLYAWVPQFDPASIIYNTLTAFQVHPDYLNNILVYGYNYRYLLNSDGSAYDSEAYGKLYAQDPFICHAEFDVSKASKMSKYSLVNL